MVIGFVVTDSFLPRVVELATLSSNRQTKIAACELLHALVIYMIGREAQAHGLDVKHHMHALYRKIFPAVFQLVCDVELVWLHCCVLYQKQVLIPYAPPSVYSIQ